MSNIVNYLKAYEAFSSKPYICSAGKLTIGYGHVILPHEAFTTVTIAQAEMILATDISITQNFVNKNIKINLNENQYDAITSLVFNWGTGNFAKSKGLRYLNNNDLENAKIQFFSKEYGVVKVNGEFCEGLYNRRQSELKLFNK